MNKSEAKPVKAKEGNKKKPSAEKKIKIEDNHNINNDLRKEIDTLDKRADFDLYLRLMDDFSKNNYSEALVNLKLSKKLFYFCK